MPELALRLVGPLAWWETCLPFFERIELEVAPDDAPRLRLQLEGEGHKTTVVRDAHRLGIEVDGLEPFVVWLRDPRSKEREPKRGAAELELMMEDLYGPNFRTYGLTRRE